jgi:hypothetical protein
MSDPALTDFERGVIVGILIGEGSLGGDGRQPHVALRLHTRHERLLRWLAAVLPGTRLYGPYHHGGRSYLQWMARGSVLSEVILPLLESAARLDDHAAARLDELRRRYPRHVAPGDPARASSATSTSTWEGDGEDVRA